MSESSSQSILRGELHVRARAAVDELMAALDRPYDDWPLARPNDPAGIRSASLGSGRAGLALFYAHAAVARGSSSAEVLAVRFLNESIELMGQLTLDATLYNGITGIAWVADHLLDLWDEHPGEDPNAEVDEMVVAHLEHAAGRLGIDLIDGLTGIAVYALDRLPRPAARRALELVLAQLEERARWFGAGCAWPSGAFLGHGPREQAAGELSYNVGLSHGVPGVAGLLSRLVTYDFETRRARRLLEGGAVWLLGQRLPVSCGSTFPAHVSPGSEAEPSRTAWCYGDPGVAVALLAAARSAERADWEEAAVQTAVRAARRPFEATGVVDGILCHGAAGVAHLFHRLYQATGELELRDAACGWFERCLDERSSAKGRAAGVGTVDAVPAADAGRDDAVRGDALHIAGFSSWSFERTRDGEAIADPCWLSGAAGIGLALLSATDPVDRGWDRLLLADLPALRPRSEAG